MVPRHAGAGSPITVTYDLGTGACVGKAFVLWDGSDIDPAKLVGTTLDAATCSAHVKTRLPAHAPAGTHLVSAIACLSAGCGRGDANPATSPALPFRYVIDRLPPTTPKPTDTTPKPRPRPSPSPAPDPRPGPSTSPEPGPTPTPTPSPSTSPTPSPGGSEGAVAAATGTPKPSSGTGVVVPGRPSRGPAGSTEPGPAGPAGSTEPGSAGPAAVILPGPSLGTTGDPFPQLVRAVVTKTSVSVDVAVIVTNLILTLFVVLLFGFSSALFNSTIDGNREALDAGLDRLLRPLRRLAAPLLAITARLTSRLPNRPGPPRMVRLTLVLLLTAIIYGFLSQDFALDGKGIALLISLFIGLAVVTYLSEGFATQFASKRLGAQSSLELFGPAIAIAVFCVLLSRVLDFQPGILYGFVASAVVIGASLSRRQEAEAVIVPSLLLLAVSLVSWIVLIPLRPVAETSGDWPFVLLASIAAMVFLAGLEGLFYSMIPLTFMDGATVFKWSRVAWAMLFGTSTFLFFELVINPGSSYMDAFRNTNVVLALVLVGVFVLFTIGTWGYFRYRAGRAPDDSAAVQG